MRKFSSWRRFVRLGGLDRVEAAFAQAMLSQASCMRNGSCVRSVCMLFYLGYGCSYISPLPSSAVTHFLARYLVDGCLLYPRRSGVRRSLLSAPLDVGHGSGRRSCASCATRASDPVTDRSGIGGGNRCFRRPEMTLS
jgi:hypothetical protein